MIAAVGALVTLDRCDSESEAQDVERGKIASPGDASSTRVEPTGSNQSIRSRGAAAPVSLLPTPTPEPTEDPDPTRSGNRELRANRVWPMKIGTYSFTQPYGCVAQIDGFYRTTDRCPSDRPAVHQGIDLAAESGTVFFAPASGEVVEAGLDRATGLANSRLVIEHDGENRGFATEYLHWSASFVKPGDKVEAGQPLGRVGSVGYSTGPHLHFAVVSFRKDAYIDPVEWLPKGRAEGVYRGTVPRDAKITFTQHDETVPDYADPSPPPVPKERGRTNSQHADASASSDRSMDSKARARKKARHQAKRADAQAARTERRAAAVEARQEALAERARQERHEARTATDGSDPAPGSSAPKRRDQ